MKLRLNTLLVAFVVLVAACSGADGPQIPTLLEAAVSTSLSAPAGTVATSVPAVTLKDATGRGIAGVWVRFVVTGGGKSVNDSSKTSAGGVASSGGWTLGTVAGPQTLTATAAGLTPVTFTAQVQSGAVQRLMRLSTESQPGVVNVPVTSTPSVRAVDQYDNPVIGVAVIFSVASGSGTIAGVTRVTGADGIASADSWTLGTAAGAQSARADANGVSATVFSATAKAGVASKMSIVTGDGVSGVTNASLALYATLPAVKVTDAFDNPVEGVSVTFTPGTNSGTVTGSTGVTNEFGVIAVQSWTLGGVASQRLVAMSTSIPGVQVVFTVTAVVSMFDITVRYIDGAPSARQQLAVQRAVDKWKSVITSGSGTSKVVVPTGACGRDWAPALNENVTNVLILAKIGTIDGPGKVLGNANSCVLHSSTQLTVLGTMFFDSEDLAGLEGNGLVDALLLHEMGHVLGIGSQWNSKGLMNGRGGSDPIFTGAAALLQFPLIGGASYAGRPVPVENSGGSGTADVHWRETVFRNEIMTGYLNSGLNPLSRVTVASLQDLGYAVNLLFADSYSLLVSSLLASPFETTVHLQGDLVDTPIITMDDKGRRGVPAVRNN